MSSVAAKAFESELSRIREQNLYRDETWLRELYHEQGCSIRDIAAIADVHDSTVHKWLDRFDIERRPVGSHRKEWATFCHHSRGYEKWTAYYAPESLNEGVLVHRLAAVAWFGFDAVAGNDIHHTNSVPWDNRESNLAPLSREEHARLHGEARFP